MSTYKPEPGHGPAPNMPPSTMDAAKLPPKITDKYVFFFGFEGPEPENCFQQWYPSPFHDGERHFRTSEQYMMHQKALLMGDEEVAKQMLAAETPAEAKTLGRQVKNFDQKVWDAECDRVVEQGNWFKFSQNKQCQKALLDTGDRDIIEASPSDRIWGVGFNSEDAEAHVSEWGENKLGKALMRVRDRINSGQIAE